MNFTIANSLVDNEKIPKIVFRIKKALDALPDGDLLTHKDMWAMLGVCRTTVTDAKGHPALLAYSIRAKINSKYYVLFGNPRTIAAYKQEFCV